MQSRILGPLEVSDDDRRLELGATKRRSLRSRGPTSLSRLRKDLGDRLMTRPPGCVFRVGSGDLAPDGTRTRFGWSLTGAGA
jgi:hypothetical protein